MTERDLDIPVARVFKPLLQPARYKGAYGGRGSGKSHFMAERLVQNCVLHPGYRAVCIREMQKSIKESSKHLVEQKIKQHGLLDMFDITLSEIRTPGDGLIMFTSMKDHSAGTIKSLEGCHVAWVDEAQFLTARSLSLLRPTIRVDGSELWFSWNPTRRGDAVDEFLRYDPPNNPAKPSEHAIVVKANWRDNPWFNETIEAERQIELAKYPERYDHTWEGGYAAAFEGAYFGKVLQEARAQKRIGYVQRDPMLPLRAYFDLGGAGANADAFCIWIVQFVGQEIRVLDYHEEIGQVLAYHVDWLRSNGYDKAMCFLPHDGIVTNNVTGKRIEDHLRDADITNVTTIPNQGRGAAGMRIEAVRRLMHKCWFNDRSKGIVDKGLPALGFYHEKRDEKRSVGMGPEHDWASHGADAFGLMAVCYEEPGRVANFNRPLSYPRSGVA